MTMARTWLLLLGLALEAAAGPPTIMGDLGRPLSADEISEIARTVSTNATTPWLLVVQRGQFGGEFVYAYSTPATETPEIHRGTRTLLSRGLPNFKAAWERWKLNGRGWYAQVAVPGRDWTRFEGERDLIQPFGVGSGFSNEELVSLTKFVRSGPTWIGPSGKGERVEGDWPIDSIERAQKGLVVVKTRKNISSGQVLKLRVVEEQWQIIGIGFWVL